MSRSGTSNGDGAAGHDLWPAGARNVPRLRGEVMSGDRGSVVVRTGSATVSVRGVEEFDDPREDDDEVVIFIKGARLAIRLDDDIPSVRTLGARNGHSLRRQSQQSPESGEPHVEIVRRDPDQPDPADEDFHRQDNLEVPWQDAPIQVWTAPARPAAEDDQPASISVPAQPDLDVPAGDDSDDWPDTTDEDSDTTSDEPGDEGVLFRSVWDSEVRASEAAAGRPAPDPDGQSPAGPARATTDDASPEPDDSVTRLRPRRGRRRRRGRGRRILRRLAILVVVAGLIAGALYGGSILGARLIGDGSPPEAADPPVSPEVVIRSATDSGDTTLSRFNVERPWAVNWSSTASGPFRIEAVAANGDRTTLVDVTAPDEGIAEVDDTGIFSLEVIAEGDWRLTVVERSTTPGS